MLRLNSPAKVNLYLKILRKRPDGYHEIESVMTKIGLCDKIALRLAARGIKISCSHPDVPLDAANLAYQAAERFFRKTRRNEGVEIFIEKKIPVAGGLGGGSSNAAAVLLGLNSLARAPLDRETLMEMGSTIGSDVPFFLSGFNTALARGKGEQLSGIKTGRELCYLLVNPQKRLLAREVYQGFRIDLTRQISGVNILISALEKGDLPGIGKSFFNDLEKTAENKMKVIGRIKDAFNAAGAERVLLSGSGPTVFSVDTSLAKLRRIKERLKTEPGWKTFVVKEEA